MAYDLNTIEKGLNPYLVGDVHTKPMGHKLYISSHEHTQIKT